MKNVFTIVFLLLITSSSYLSVKAFYVILAANLVINPLEATPIKIPKKARRFTPVKGLKSYDIIAKRDLFKTGKVETVVKPTPVVEEKNLEKYKKTDLKLHGTIAGIDEMTAAIIENKMTRKQDLYRIGQTVRNARIKRILREKVVITVNGRDEILEMEIEMGARRGRSPKGSYQSSRSINSDNYSISRAAVDNAFNNLNTLMRQIKVRPHFSRGKPDGMLMTRIKPGSLFTKMGLKNGDILVGVDGEMITSTDDALRLYSRLKSSNRVVLQIKRRGKISDIEYFIR